MTLDHDDFDRRLAETEDLDALDPELADHANECQRCAARFALARRIRATAPTLVEAGNRDDGDNITTAVLARTHRSTSRFVPLLAAAAGLVVVAGVGATVLRSSDQPTDLLADIADEYQNSESIRFVYATEATIDLSERFELDTRSPDPITALSTTLPTCADNTDNTDTDGETRVESSGGVDLGPIVDAIASDDPCLALQLIDQSAEPARDAYNTLASSIQERQSGVDSLSDADIDNALVDAAIDAFTDEQRDQIEIAREALDDLDRSFAALADTVEPLTSTDTPVFSSSAIEDGLTALRAGAVAADDVGTAIDTRIAWTQISTGTWSPDGVTIAGVTERNDLNDEYSSVADDPLGLATVVLNRPQTLLDLIDSAPASTADRIEWDVPAGVLDSDLDWTATARLDDGGLQQIVLRSTEATITVSPER